MYTYLIRQKKNNATVAKWSIIYSCNNGEDAIRYLRELTEDNRKDVEYDMVCVKEKNSAR